MVKKIESMAENEICIDNSPWCKVEPVEIEKKPNYMILYVNVLFS